MKELALLALLGATIVGCAAGSEPAVSESDEQKFKNPGPVDPNKIPKEAFSSSAPRYVGEPSGASNPSGSTPPPAAGP